MTLIRLQRGDNKVDSFTWFTEGTQVRNVEIKINTDIKVNLADHTSPAHPTSRLTQFLQRLFGNAQVGARRTIDDRRAIEDCYYHGECRAGDAAFDAFRGHGATPAGCTPSIPLIGGARLQTFSLGGGAPNYELKEIGVNIRKKTKKYNIEIKFGLPGDIHHEKKYKVELILNVHLTPDYGDHSVVPPVLPISPADAANNFRQLISQFLHSATNTGLAVDQLDGVTQVDLSHIEALEWDTYKKQLINFGIAYDEQKVFNLAFKSIPAFREVAEARRVKQQQALFRMMAGGDAVIAARRDQSLFESVVRDDLDAVKMWCDFEADIRCTGNHENFDQTPVYVVAVELGHTQIIRYLTDKGAHLDANGTAYKDIALFRAAERGDEDAVRRWLAYGADHSMKNARLFDAVVRNDEDAVCGWLACEPDLMSTHDHADYLPRIPAIVIALNNDYAGITEILHGAGPDLDTDTIQYNQNGYTNVTLLIFAIEQGYTAMALALLDMNAEPTIEVVKTNGASVSPLSAAQQKLQVLRQTAQAANNVLDPREEANYGNIIQRLGAAN